MDSCGQDTWYLVRITTILSTPLRHVYLMTLKRRLHSFLLGYSGLTELYLSGHQWLEPEATKIRANNLQINGDVRRVDGCVDFSV